MAFLRNYPLKIADDLPEELIFRMDSFFQAISRFTELSENSRSALASVMKEYDLPKGKVLVRPGSVCDHVYFVDRGLARTFYFKDGKDVTDWISTETSFSVSIISFITRQPDRRGIELLEPSHLYALHHHDLERLCEKHHDIETMNRHLISFGLIQVQQKFDDLHFSGALQRYQRLMETNPTIINRVPLGMIASFLGITQETLSRIRGQI